MKNIEKLKPFTRFCITIGNLPTSYAESMTYEEQLLWFCNFLQTKVIPAVNNNAEAVIELQEYVESYFDNLDVQEEIDHKLDEMVLDGTLQEIITEYLQINGVIGFNTVADMKSATNIINGSYAKTLGFYELNDNGGATYKIRTITNEDVVDEMFIIALDDDTLIAELITDNVSILQLGGKGDDTFDNTSIAEASIEKLNYVYFPKGIYRLNLSYNQDDLVKIYGDGQDSVLKSYMATGDVINITCDLISKPKIISDLYIELESSQNGVIVALTTRLDNFYPHKIDVHNVKIYTTNTFNGIGFKFENIREFNVSDLVVRRRRGDDSVRTGTGIYVAGCLDIDIKNSDLGFLDKGIELETKDYSTEGILIDNVDIFFCNTAVSTRVVNDKQFLDIRILNCNVDQIQQVGFLLDGIVSGYIFNNWLGAYVNNAHILKLAPTNKANSHIHILSNSLYNTYSDRTNNSNILIDTTNNDNKNINIIDNTITHYNEKGIEIIGSTAINGLIINSNIFESSTDVENNKPITYVTKPLNMKLNDNIVKAAAMYVLDDFTFNSRNNKNIYNKTMLSTITLVNNQQNTNDFPIQLLLAGTNTSANKGRINVYMGPTSSTMQEITKVVPAGTVGGYEETLTVIVPANWWYSVNKTSDVTLSVQRITPIL